jgi:hypothetical protein
VLLDQDVPGQAQQNGQVRERADRVGAALEALTSRVRSSGTANHGAIDRVREVPSGMRMVLGSGDGDAD